MFLFTTRTLPKNALDFFKFYPQYSRLILKLYSRTHLRDDDRSPYNYCQSHNGRAFRRRGREREGRSDVTSLHAWIRENGAMWPQAVSCMLSENTIRYESQIEFRHCRWLRFSDWTCWMRFFHARGVSCRQSCSVIGSDWFCHFMLAVRPQFLSW